jgi:hypothetical protein
VVLADRDAVEAELLGVLELVEVAVVELVADLGSKCLLGKSSDGEAYFSSKSSGRNGYGMRWKKTNFMSRSPIR